ncbi:MAG: DinB family protein [Anaerolineae bacterium]
MLSRDILLTMYHYNHDINNRLLGFARHVTPQQWLAPLEAGQWNLHQILFHILSVEEEWLTVSKHGTPIWDSRSITDFPDVDSLLALSDQAYQTFLPYIESLTDDILTSTVNALMPDGLVKDEVIWHMLLHNFYHSAQHRSEVAVLLTRYGHSPGFIDIYGYIL